MTVAARSVETPIARSIERAGETFQYLGAQWGQPSEGQFVAANVIANPDAVREMLDAVCAMYGTEDRQIAASFLVLGYFWYPMASAIACYLLDGRLPDLTPENVVISPSGGVTFCSPHCWALPGDPDAGHPQVTIVADRDALRARLVTQLEQQHAAPLFATLRSVAPYGVNGMRANFADRLASAVMWLGETLGEPDLIRSETPAFLSHLEMKHRSGLIEVEHEGRQGIFLKRGGCCLNYRLPNVEKCDTCSLRPMEERLLLFRGHLTGEPGNAWQSTQSGAE